MVRVSIFISRGVGVDKKKNLSADPARPYDDSVWERMNMYDSMPYIWNPDLCDTRKLSVESGNVIKACRCLMKEPYEVKH